MRSISVGASVSLALVVASSAALADGGQCHVVDVSFTPTEKLQVVAWIEDAAGNYVDTVYITQQTGTFGLGNRPGRFDFNSGPRWPYGRRTTVFPVWSHRHGKTFPQVEFQNQDEDNLSHPFNQSSREDHFCRPMMPGEPGWDTATCASTVFTDKGQFSATATTHYPPRVDITRQAGMDSPSVDMFHAMNPFDGVSQATPAAGTAQQISWSIPQSLPTGNYVMYVEASKEFDYNSSYNCTYNAQTMAWTCTFPPPVVPWETYGQPYRGQPAVVYRVPFAIGTTGSTAATASYAGYADPAVDGALHPPDATITTDTPGSGASRLQLVSDGGATYRVRVDAHPEQIAMPPSVPTELHAMTTLGQSVVLAFTAPASGTARVKGYDIRVRANEPITDANFATSTPVTANVVPADPGALQTFQIDGLLPETDYWVGVRAYDACRNASALAVVQLHTAARQVGEVSACFIATAAYGSAMANDVELLRHFRDSMLHRTVLGELAVETYYTFGPAVAGVVGESDLLRTAARDLLAPIVRFVRRLRY